MDFWHELFPQRIYNLRYENLTENQEIETKKLLQYLDLEWDEKCLNFFENERAVKTPSTLQVRKKCTKEVQMLGKNIGHIYSLLLMV